MFTKAVQEAFDLWGQVLLDNDAWLVWLHEKYPNAKPVTFGEMTDDQAVLWKGRMERYLKGIAEEAPCATQ